MKTTDRTTGTVEDTSERVTYRNAEKGCSTLQVKERARWNLVVVVGCLATTVVMRADAAWTRRSGSGFSGNGITSRMTLLIRARRKPTEDAQRRKKHEQVVAAMKLSIDGPRTFDGTCWERPPDVLEWF